MEKIMVMNPKISKWQERVVEKVPFCLSTPQTITPKQAEIYLRNNANRPLKTSRVTQLMRDIQSGSFSISNDVICFDKEGRLLNGQHRLMACMKSGKPIAAFVGYGYSKTEQACMDVGVGRNLHDVSVLNGIDVTGTEASIARFVRSQTITGKIPKRATRQEEMEFIIRHYDILKETGELLGGQSVKKNDRTGFKFNNDIGAAFFRALSYYQNEPEKKDLVRQFATALLVETQYVVISGRYNVQGLSITDRNRALILRFFRKYIDESRRLMRRGGQDQGGRNAKYKMAERCIDYFVNPPATLLSRIVFKNLEDGPELYPLEEEVEATNA